MSIDKSVSSQDSTEDHPAWPAAPWFDIWTKPRGTIRSIISSDPTKYVIVLAILSGIAQVLSSAAEYNLGDQLPLPFIFVIVLIAGSIMGMISLYIGGAILRWSGGLMGGRASATEVRAAIAWSAIPTIFATILWVPQLALFGTDLFTSMAPRIYFNPSLYLFFSIVQLVLGLWAFVLLLKTLGEIHGFSAWKGLASLAIPTLMFAVPSFCCLAAGMMSL